MSRLTQQVGRLLITLAPLATFALTTGCNKKAEHSRVEATPALAASPKPHTDLAGAQNSDLTKLLVGTWQGRIEVGADMALTLVFVVTNTSSNELDGAMYSINDPTHLIPLSSATISNDVIRLNVASLAGRFKGRFRSDKTEIAGTWKQSGREFPIDLKPLDKVLIRPIGTAKGTAPLGWFAGTNLAGTRPDSYEMSVDRTKHRGGAGSARLQALVDRPEGFGTLMQSISATDYLAKKVRFSGFVMTSNAPRAGLWVRVDGPGSEMLTFDNMGDRSIFGTTDWSPYAVVVYVPSDAVAIHYGLLSTGGTAWMDDMTFEEVGPDTPTTGVYAQDGGGQGSGQIDGLPEPVNLGFESQ